MANAQAPYGFRHIGQAGGAAPNFANAQGKIAQAYATPIYFGDPLVRLNTGYLAKAAPGTTQIAGIFIGCEYLSIAKGYKTRGQYFPGNDAAADVEVQYIGGDNGGARFQVQTGPGGPATQAAVGQNINFAIGTPTPAVFLSGAYADLTTLGTTTTLPFRVLGLVSDPPGVNGADLTTPFNDIIVGFNNQDFKSLVGI